MASYHTNALDFAREGKWEESHSLIQKYDDTLSFLIHAYLHRVEGDIPNAEYWYRRAGEQMPDVSVDKELDLLFERITD